MEGFFETAGSVLLLLGGGWAAISSALKAREMRLSRVNEHGVRVWKSAADSFIAPLQINALWILAALFAFVAFMGLARLSSDTNAPQTVQPYPSSLTHPAAVAPSAQTSIAPTNPTEAPSDPAAVESIAPPATVSESVSRDIVDPTISPPEAETSRDRTLNVYGLVVRRATPEELAERGVRRDYGLIIVDMTPDNRWEGSRPGQLPPDVGDIIISGVGGGGWEDPADFLSYATRPYRVCVDGRRAVHPGVTSFCTPATQ